MDASASNWLSDMLMQETEDCELFRQCHLNLFDDDDEDLLSHELASVLNDDNFQQQQPLSSESYSSYSETLMSSFKDEPILERPNKQPKIKTSSWKLSSSSSSPSTPTSQILSFDGSNTPPPNTDFYGVVSALSPKKQNECVGVSVSPPRTRKRGSESQNFKNESNKGDKCPSHVRDHIMAERKRRENLSRSLIALAALIPGLKKMDKASVLGDAIKYVKELKERLRMLEEEQNKNRDMESVVTLNSDDSSGSRDDDGKERLPRVEARVSEKDVLLRIHCQKQKGLLLKILVEIQNLHLLVINSSVLPFGDSILNITIVAQMGTGYNLAINDLVENVRVATLQFMP